MMKPEESTLKIRFEARAREHKERSLSAERAIARSEVERDEHLAKCNACLALAESVDKMDVTEQGEIAEMLKPQVRL